MKGYKIVEIGIYKITSPSGKIYIGQSVDIQGRFKRYLRYCCKNQAKLYNSLIKYGSENHTYEILELCTREEIHKKEKYYVDLYQTFNTSHGLNIRDGGGNKGKISDEQKEKIRNTLMGHVVTQETRQKMSDSNKGRVGYWTGKKRPDFPSNKKILQYSLNGDFIKEWKNVKEITQCLNYYHGLIRKCCLGINKTAKGYIWKYDLTLN